MIESCNKKRMLLGIVFLGGLTVIVLVIESHWTEQGNNHLKSVDNSTKAEHHCWETESFEIVEPCHPCSEFEIASRSVEACIPTHFKEGIRCHVSGKTQRSCTKVKWIEEKKYWMFEIAMFVLALTSYSVVYVRQRVLDRRVMLRIQKQLANGLDGFCLAPLETVICLFTYKYCDQPILNLIFVLIPENKTRAKFKIKISMVLFEEIVECDIEGVASNCKLPVVVLQDGSTVVGGLCAVLRQTIKLVDPKHPLLGFKQSCLYACAESSLWTKFCEVDIVETVNCLLLKENWKCDLVEIPPDVARFEVHMSQPVKIHNIQKEKQDFARSKGIRKVGVPDSRLALVNELDHKYAEGHKMTLADVLLFSNFHIIFEYSGSFNLKQHLPLSYEWYENMAMDERVKNAMEIFAELDRKFDGEIYVNYTLPDVGRQSLYKGEAKKNQPKRHFYTRQEDIIICFEKVKDFEELVPIQSTTFGNEIDFDWKTVPTDGTPIPAKRLERKGQQLENMTKAVLKIARNGDRIIDFCSGSGHLGLILAHALPRCRIILIENKEQSLKRAKDRAEKLKLSNIFFCQSNVDYFKGEFDIGVSLHACGVATDLVMDICMRQNAAFVCCPCCYGSIQPNHIISYPRSEVFRNSRLTLKEYLILGHASDQTHDEENAKTSQGNKCMAIIDSDRCLRAKEAGYSIFLSKLDPPTCTPKNNLLVGIPGNRGGL